MRGRKVHEVETKWRTAPRTDDVVSRRFKFGGPKSPRAAFKDPLAHTRANSSLRTPAHTRFIVSRPNFSILLRAILLGVSVHRGVCEWTSCACFLPKSAGAPGRRRPTGPMSGRHLCAGCGCCQAARLSHSTAIYLVSLLVRQIGPWSRMQRRWLGASGAPRAGHWRQGAFTPTGGIARDHPKSSPFFASTFALTKYVDCSRGSVGGGPGKGGCAPGVCSATVAGQRRKPTAPPNTHFSLSSDAAILWDLFSNCP